MKPRFILQRRFPFIPIFLFLPHPSQSYGDS